MKWVGQHIWDFISRFRSDVYLESVDSGTIASGGNLGLDSNNKVVKATGVSSVTVTDSNTNTAFPVVFHDESNNLLDDTSGFTYNPSLGIMKLASSTFAVLELENSVNSVADPQFNMYNSRGGAAGVDGDDCGTIVFYGNNNAGTPEQISFGTIKTSIQERDDGDEAGIMRLLVATSDSSTSTNQQALTATGHATANKIDIGLGYGAASLTTIAGNVATDGGSFLMRDVTDSGDYFNIGVTTHGATTLTTIDDDDTAANITLDADGEIILDAADPYIRLYNNGTEMGSVSYHHSATYLQLDENGGSGTDYFDIKVEASGVTTIGTLDNAGTDANLTLNIDGKIEMQSSVSKFNKIYDFNATTFENLYSDDEGTGKILRYSPGADDSPAGSELFFLDATGAWSSTRNVAVANGASQLLGVGLGASARTTGVLIEGFIRIASTEINNVPGSGAVDGKPVYIGADAGHFDFTAPSASGSFVRVVGYAIDDDGGDVLIYFKPSSTWIEIA
jgi:hypothetical protein